MNGAPRIAPTPISSEASPVANTIAMIGMSVSGSAVPDRRQDGAYGPFGQVDGTAEPLDPVREELGADEDDHERDEQDEQIQGSGSPGSPEVRGPSRVMDPMIRAASERARSHPGDLRPSR